MDRGKKIGYGILLVALILIVIGAITDVKPFWVIGIILLPVSLVIRVLIEYYDDETEKKARREQTRCYQEGRLAERKAWESKRNEIEHTNIIQKDAVDTMVEENEEDNEEEEIELDNSITSDPIIIDKLQQEYQDLCKLGGARQVRDISTDPAGHLLLEICENLLYSPVNGFTPISFVAKEDFDGAHAINFIRMGDVVSSAEFIYLFLVLTKQKNIRIFTVETSPCGALLCEYSPHMHSIIDLLDSPMDIPTKIKEFLNKEGKKDEENK